MNISDSPNYDDSNIELNPNFNLATDIFLTKQEVEEIIKSGGTFANLPQHDDLYTDPFTGLYQAV